MTLESNSSELVADLKILSESMNDLLRLITEDRPYEHSLAHRFEHTATECLGRLEAATACAIAFQQYSGQYDLGQAFAALGTCHREFNLAEERLSNELKSFDWLQDLQALGNERPNEWLGWTASIKATLDQCNTTGIQEIFLKCWQSLFISSGALSTQHIKNIGQQNTENETPGFT